MLETIEKVKVEVKGLINPEIMENYIKKNNDPYGGACVAVALNVMKYLDSFEKAFNIGYAPDLTTTHGIITHCDNQGGITGFMAGAVRNMVCLCHKIGWQFYIADCLSPYDVNHQDRIDKIINNVCNCKELNIEKEDVKNYTKDLIERFKEKHTNN